MEAGLADLLAQAEVTAGATDALAGPLLARQATSVSAALFAGDAARQRQTVEERLAAYRASAGAVRAMIQSSGLPSPSAETVWDVHLALAQHLVRIRPKADACFLVAIVGGPGAGKTTLTRILELFLRQGFGFSTASMSSDDFYLPRSERLKRGLRWRGPIESHDTDALREVLSGLRAGRALAAVPRFDPAMDDRIGVESVPGPLDFCLFEGWTTAALLDSLNGAAAPPETYTVFLKADVDFLRTSRLEKEAAIRARSANQRGMPMAEMLSFWDSVIAPGLDRYVHPFEAKADVMIRLGSGHRVLSVAPA